MAEHIGLTTPDTSFESMAASLQPLIQTVQTYWHDTAKPLIITHIVSKCPPALQDILSQDTTYLAIATLFLFMILIIVGRALAGGSASSSSSSSGPAVLLVGPCDAGKTALLHTLQGYPAQGTVASIKQTEATVLSGGQRVRVVDIPGHPRVRGAVLGRYAPSVSKLVFVVNSLDFMAQRSDTAEYVFCLWGWGWMWGWICVLRSTPSTSSPLQVACGRTHTPRGGEETPPHPHGVHPR